MSTSLSFFPADAATATSLASILAELLAVEEVDQHSHFFDDLGADSMLMARFCARVRKRDDLPTVDMRDIYQHPSIDQLLTAMIGITLAPGDAPPVGDSVEPAPVLGATGAAARSGHPVPSLSNAPVRPPRPSVGQGAYIVCGILQFVAFVIYSSLNLLIMVKSFEWVTRGGSILGNR